MVRGTGVSEGIGIGFVHILKEQKPVFERHSITDVEKELEKLRNAVGSFVISTEKLAEKLKNEAGEKEADILVFISDVRKVLHAHYSDLIIKVIDESGILIYKYDAASGCLDCFICEFDHSLGLAASFMSNQKLHHRSVPPLFSVVIFFSFYNSKKT